MSTAKKAAIFAAGWLLAVTFAVVAQVYNYFPPPGWVSNTAVSTGSYIVTPAAGTATVPVPSNGTLISLQQVAGTGAVYDETSFAVGGAYMIRRADGTATSLAALANGDSLGSFQWRGYNGSAFSSAAGQFACFATQAWTNAAEGLDCGVATIPNNSTTLTTQVTFGATQASGNVGEVVPSAGTTTSYLLGFPVGVVLTTPQIGSWEYDGTVAYFTPTASSRSVNMVEQLQTLNAAYTLTSQTAAQKLLNGTTNGTLTLPVGTFDFECQYALSSMSATSGTFGFALGGTATFTQNWTAQASMPSALATATAPFISTNTAANTALTAATTTTFGEAMIQGNIRVTVAGTVIPEVSLSVAAAAVVATGSFCRFKPIGASAVVSVGNWS